MVELYSGMLGLLGVPAVRTEETAQL